MWVLRTKWYLALQDGRYGDKEYDSEGEAKEAYDDLPSFEKKGICILSYEKREYDSTADTLMHIRRVQEYLGNFAKELIDRGVRHDASKLDKIEKPHFDRESALLKTLTVNTPEYKASLGRLKLALDHHYAANSHHPEHYANGVNGMDLFDIIEMFADWKAASERNKGDFVMESSFNRFGFDDQLRDIFTNTAKKMGWIPS